MFWLTLIYFYNTWQGSSEAERKAGELQEQLPAPPAPNPAGTPTPKIPVGTTGGRDVPPVSLNLNLDVDPPGASHPARLQLHELN